uniref:EGF-like domain-containing protein n=1 Tax=Timema douglasi TaxID=61478 RepID=A0A7R8VCY3_TIMDO|nr:unnamed protein product [Timema douglasi]
MLQQLQIHSYGGIGFGIKREIFFLNLEDGYFGCQVNESTDVLQLYELSKLCDGTSDCFMASDELTKELKCTKSSQLKPNKSWFSKCTVWQLKICSQRDLTSLDQFIVQSENNGKKNPAYLSDKLKGLSHVENVPGDVHNNPQTLVLECLQPPYTRVRQVASSATRMNRPEQPLVLCQSVPHEQGATDRVLDVINKWLEPNKLTYYWMRKGVLNAQLTLPVEHPPLRRESVGPNLSRRMNPSAHPTSLPCGGVPPEETAANRKTDCDKEDGVKCQNGACLDSQCHCNDGFGGCSCEVPDENECKYRPCDVFAHCTNTLGSFHCTCFPGYMGDGFACEDHVRFTSKRSTKRGPVVRSLTHFKRTERARGTGEVGSHLYGNQSKVHPLAPILPHFPPFLTVPLNLLTHSRPPTTMDARSYRQIAYVSLRRRAEMSMAFINETGIECFQR